MVPAYACQLDDLGPLVPERSRSCSTSLGGTGGDQDQPDEAEVRPGSAGVLSTQRAAHG
jgi:hypothetical protein